MVRKENEQVIEYKNIRGGNGEAKLRLLLNGADELYGKGKLFNIITLTTGNSVGKHMHHGDNEIYYFLSGSGEYDDNGSVVTVVPGDVAICNDGESHALVNNSDEPLVFVALILNS